MATKYPASIDTSATLIPITDGRPITGSSIDQLRIAILAIENELGVKPSGVYGTVLARLNTIDATIANIEAGPSQTLIGDVTGIISDNIISKLAGNPLSQQILGPSQSGYVLTWVTNQWIPMPNSGGVIFATDLSGNALSQTVVGLQGVPLANTTPVQSAVPIYDTSTGRYDVRQLTLDDVGPAFAISSFSGGSTVEIGATVTNPSFIASYASQPTSASITNTDNIDSPLNLTSPFTSGTVVGSFTHSVQTSVVFTLTAIAATTKTATTDINFYPRSFFGIGTAGATGATASGSSAILVGASGTLSSQGLQNSVVGLTTSSVSPSNQKIYFLCIHTSTPHTFHDQNGFGFPMNSPTTFSFTNQNSAVISMDLYESTNLNTATFTLTVVS